MPAKKMITVEIAAMRSEFHKGYQSIGGLRCSDVAETQASSTYAASAAYKRFAAGKTLARTEFIFGRAGRDSGLPLGGSPMG